MRFHFSTPVSKVCALFCAALLEIRAGKPRRADGVCLIDYHFKVRTFRLNANGNVTAVDLPRFPFCVQVNLPLLCIEPDTTHPSTIQTPDFRTPPVTMDQILLCRHHPLWTVFLLSCLNSTGICVMIPLSGGSIILQLHKCCSGSLHPKARYQGFSLEHHCFPTFRNV